LPLLARSLAARDQILAAMVCYERARELGAGASELDAPTRKLATRLGDAWPEFQAWMNRAE
ncbi:MAG: hypothetical protein WBN29_10835, partial [Polyangiales bacterium]